MTRVLTLVLFIASAALGTRIWFAVVDPTGWGDASIPSTSRQVQAAPPATAHDDSPRRRDEVTMILARPLFSPTRRPKEDAAAPAQAAASLAILPRMSAILINGKLRSAIFDGSGKPTVLGEGGHLGPFTIQSIEPQQVTIIGPDGKRIVRTSFSNDPPPAAMQLPPGLQQTLPQGPPAPLPVVLPPGMPTPNSRYPGASR